MAATVNQIRGWLAVAKGDPTITHVLVKCDSFEPADSCCYPIYVTKGQDPQEANSKNNDRFMECYAMHLDVTAQLAEFRAHHFEMPPEVN